MSDDASDITHSSVSSAPTKQTVSFSFNSRKLIKLIIVIILIGLAFWVGVIVGHRGSPQATTISSSSGFSRFSGRGFGGGSFGTVQDISSGSITVEDSRSGTSKTYAITSSTEITNNGQSATASAISDGESVIVIPSSSNSSQAARILVNPSFGGPGGSATNSATTE